MKGFAAVGFVATAGALSICPLCGSVRNALHSPSSAYMLNAVVGRAKMQAAVTSMAALNVVTLKITGMTCGGCVFGVRTVLTRLDGVTKADVSYEKGNAVVSFDPTKTTVEQMIAAIKTLGYTAAVAS